MMKVAARDKSTNYCSSTKNIIVETITEIGYNVSMHISDHMK